MPTVNKGLEDARSLVKYATGQQLPALKKAYDEAAETRTVTPTLLIATKNFLDNLRSALEYTAHGLYEAAFGKMKKGTPIYYPYAREDRSAKEFRKILNKRMPGYGKARPDVAQVLEGLQHQTGNNFVWVPRFMDLSNSAKHHNLGEQLPFFIHGMQITASNDRLIIQGGSLTVDPGATVTIAGQPIPPGTYDHKNLPPLPPGAVVEILTPIGVVFADTKDLVFRFLRKALEGVAFIVERLIEAESTKPPKPPVSA